MTVRLGFLGTGWIGCHRMLAVREAGAAEIAAFADPDPERRSAVAAAAPEARACAHLGELLELPLDGIVIATPSALHADQAIAALDRGFAVFCQKPLARTAAEAARVVDAARSADRLLGLDLSYRHTAAAVKMRELIAGGGIGRPFAVKLEFHNAYGPEAKWFYDRSEAGGGCLVDLGVHLVDLALWLLDFPEIEAAAAQLLRRGQRLRANECEDYAAAQLRLAGDVAVQLACSWRLSAGRDAVIEAAVYGTEGGVALRNVNGSFYDFTAEHFSGTRASPLTSPPDSWGGRAIVAWANQLADGARFDRSAERYVELSRALDRIYAEAVTCA